MLLSEVQIKELENMLLIQTNEKKTLALSLNESESENQKLLSEHQSVLNKERKNKMEMEKKLIDESDCFKKENLYLKTQIQELKTTLSQSEDRILKLSSTVTKLEKQVKVNQASCDEQLLSMKEQQDEKLSATITLHQKEMSRIREESFEVERNLKQKITLLENQKSDLAETIKEKNIQILNEKSNAAELQHNTEKKMESEKDKLKLQMEERIEVLQSANKKQEDMLKEHLETMYELKTKITSLDLSLAEKTHQIQYLQQCVEEKNSEKESAIIKTGLEFKEKIEELNHINESLTQAIKDAAKKHIEELESKDKTVQKLKFELKLKNQSIHELIEKERERTTQLQKAFEVYINSARQAWKEDPLRSGNTSPR